MCLCDQRTNPSYSHTLTHTTLHTGLMCVCVCVRARVCVCVAGILEITSVDVGVVAIRGLSSNYYLAISKKGEVYGEVKYGVNCRLKERIEENGYNTYSSAQWRNRRRAMFVGLSANGRPMRGRKTRRKNTATHFLPILV
uniref:Fibroblast growth factor n=1 Tax=Astyanax mexicanus TaxID=7994 RepID=A0A3B1ITL8_ASTMX